MTTDIIILKNAALSTSISPIGGAVLALSDGETRQLLRPFKKDDYGPSNMQAIPVVETGCFPLLPLAGRLADSRFDCGGQSCQLKPNSPIDPAYIHGDGWLAHWTITKQSSDGLVMVYQHNDITSPFIYHATQSFQLSDTYLDIAMRVENRSKIALPYGIGFHPYFPRTPDLRLTFKSQYFWHNDSRNIAHHSEPTQPIYQFDVSRPLPETRVDNCFSGWDGEATFEWPTRGLKLTMECDPVFTHCQVYAPKNSDFFCFEPLSHVPNAHNMQGNWGLKILENGQSISGRMRLKVSTH